MARPSCTRRTLRLRPGVVALLVATLLLSRLGLPPVAAAEYPRLLITEILPDPGAVGDKKGEWVEIANPGDEAVNLRDWRLLNGHEEQHIIIGDVWVAGGGYVVLARNGNPAVNGGVQPAYVYAELDLANAQGQIVLAAPDDSWVDVVAWGQGSDLVSHEGASLERTALDPTAPWVVAAITVARLGGRPRQSRRGLYAADTHAGPHRHAVAHRHATPDGYHTPHTAASPAQRDHDRPRRRLRRPGGMDRDL